MIDETLFSVKRGVLYYNGELWTGYGPLINYGYRLQSVWYDNGIPDKDNHHVPSTIFPLGGGISAHDLRLSLEDTLEEAQRRLNDYATPKFDAASNACENARLALHEAYIGEQLMNESIERHRERLT